MNDVVQWIVHRQRIIVFWFFSGLSVMSLLGKVALVTGASSGIGAATAVQLARWTKSETVFAFCLWSASLFSQFGISLLHWLQHQNPAVCIYIWKFICQKRLMVLYAWWWGGGDDEDMNWRMDFYHISSCINVLTLLLMMMMIGQRHKTIFIWQTDNSSNSHYPKNHARRSTPTSLEVLVLTFLVFNH